MEDYRQYNRELAKYLNCPGSLRRKLLHQTQQMADDFLAGKPDACFQEVAAFLGEPQELADVLLAEVDQEMLQRYQRRRRCCKWVLIGCAAAVFLCVCILLAYSSTIQHDAVVTATETIIIYETRDPT